MNIQVGKNFIIGRERDFYFSVEIKGYDKYRKPI